MGQAFPSESGTLTALGCDRGGLVAQALSLAEDKHLFVASDCKAAVVSPKKKNCCQPYIYLKDLKEIMVESSSRLRSGCQEAQIPKLTSWLGMGHVWSGYSHHPIVVAENIPIQ